MAARAERAAAPGAVEQLLQRLRAWHAIEVAALQRRRRDEEYRLRRALAAAEAAGLPCEPDGCGPRQPKRPRLGWLCCGRRREAAQSLGSVGKDGEEGSDAAPSFEEALRRLRALWRRELQAERHRAAEARRRLEALGEAGLCEAALASPPWAEPPPERRAVPPASLLVCKSAARVSSRAAPARTSASLLVRKSAPPRRQTPAPAPPPPPPAGEPTDSEALARPAFWKTPAADAVFSKSAGVQALQSQQLAQVDPRAVDTPFPRTTADSWNRLRDKARIEGRLGLTEHGDPGPAFTDPAEPSVVVAKGYRRVVYGDHGPYVEFLPQDVRWEAFPKCHRRGPACYYDEHFTASGSLRAYEQRREVRGKPNPPAGPWSACNNRQDGYADYRVGRVYMPADCLQLWGGALSLPPPAALWGAAVAPMAAAPAVAASVPPAVWRTPLPPIVGLGSAAAAADGAAASAPSAVSKTRPSSFPPASPPPPAEPAHRMGPQCGNPPCRGTSGPELLPHPVSGQLWCGACWFNGNLAQLRGPAARPQLAPKLLASGAAQARPSPHGPAESRADGASSSCAGFLPPAPWAEEPELGERDGAWAPEDRQGRPTAAAQWEAAPASEDEGPEPAATAPGDEAEFAAIAAEIERAARAAIAEGLASAAALAGAGEDG
ncbi:unnamed protein product [Prorocentrum cordatum]|uniref:Uncharacterized protein n=1 Tax=Prorocentrum cordatum TaxID=2364126 RepID=A0ABN9VJC6_9DINO|nr:unnamed protein product [Polarella glacialis]